MGNISATMWLISRSQQPRGLRHELPSLARTLRSWVRIPLKAFMSVLCVSVFVFCVQIEALRRADPPSKESYQLRIGSRNWKKKRPRPNKGLQSHNNNNVINEKCFCSFVHPITASSLALKMANCKVCRNVVKTFKIQSGTRAAATADI
jgi:hypothetical protein